MKPRKAFLNRLLNRVGVELVSVNRMRFYLAAVDEANRLPDPTFDAVSLAMAWYFASGRATDSTFIQIGACDGRVGDSVAPFVQRAIMNAILVEPIPDAFEALRRNYRGNDSVKLVNAAVICGDDKSPTMYILEGATSFQMASFSRKHVEKHLHRDQAGMIRALQVRGISYESLLAEAGVAFADFVQIDTEGYDCKIVNEILSCANELPKFLNFESLHAVKADADLVFEALSKNYLWIHDNWNTLAVRRDIHSEWTRDSAVSKSLRQHP